MLLLFYVNMILVNFYFVLSDDIGKLIFVIFYLFFFNQSNFISTQLNSKQKPMFVIKIIMRSLFV